MNDRFLLLTAAALASLAAPAPWAVPEQPAGVVGHWRFDQGQGRVAPDLSGNGNDAKIIGPQWTKVGKRYALRFDGKKGYVDCGSHASLNVTEAVTVEAWVCPSSYGQENYGRIVEGGGCVLLMHLGYRWGMCLALTGADGSDNRSAWREGCLFDHWYHLVGTYDGRVQKLYANGLEGQVSAAWTGRIRTTAQHLIIGNVAADGNRTFHGLIDEVILYNRALTRKEIESRYQTGRLLRRPLSTSSAESTDANTLLFEAFTDGESALKRWEFTSDKKTTHGFVRPYRGIDRYCFYVDFRGRARWSFLSRSSIKLLAGTQYTLSARVRRNLGYGAMRLVAQAAGRPRPGILAEAHVIQRRKKPQEIAVIFAPKADTAARIGFDASGYSELWIDEIRLQRNVPAISSYQTGLLLPAKPPVRQARYRTGVFLEAEDVAQPGSALTAEDKDGDGLWALCRVDADQNPWLFSENTVLKSDSASCEEGGRTPALKLTAANLLPGPYQVLLSDPKRDAAVSLDGKEWKRINGGRGEVDFGLVHVGGALSVWVEHRHRTADNPGPIYVDYVRLMPVYDSGGRHEQPAPLPAPAKPPAVQETTLRLCNAGGVSREREWVTMGLPFARGSFWPTDGVQIAGAADLAVRPLVLWPDGSVKWLHAEFRADAAAAGNLKRPVRFGRAVQNPATPSPASLRFGQVEVVARKGIWEQVIFGSQVILSKPPSVRMKTASGQVLDQLIVGSVNIEDAGPRPVISVRGALGRAGRPGPAAFSARVFETAPHTLGLQFSVVNKSDEKYQPDRGCSPASALTELALVLDGVQLAPSRVRWPCGLVSFNGDEQTLLQTGKGECVEDFAGAWTLTAGARSLASGRRTEGWVDLCQPSKGLAIGVREFFERCPKSITVKRSGSATAVEIGIWPAQTSRVMRYAQGTQLTVDVALALHDGTQSERESASRLASVLSPLRGVLPAEHYCQTGIFGPITTQTDSQFRGFYDAAAKTFRTLTTRFMRYGIEDWGDFFGPCGYVRTDTKLWTNMEWDFVHYLASEFFRTGDDAYLEYAAAAARHFADIDIIHHSSRPNWIGGSYVHTGDQREGHQVGSPNFAHAGWPQGLLWVYYMSGDERLREAAVGLADHVVRNMPPEGVYKAQPPFSMYNCMREAGNPILTLACVHELTRNPAHLHALNRIVDYALRVQDPKLGCWSVPFYEDPVYHRPSPSYGPMLYRGLHLYWQLTGDRRVAQAFNRLKRFLLDVHPAESRRHLRTGSFSHTTFSYVGEAYALASLFSDHRQSILDKGHVRLLSAFPAGRAKAVGTRGVPGTIMAGSRLTSAVILARKEGAMRPYRITEVSYGPKAAPKHWTAQNGTVELVDRKLQFSPAGENASLKWSFYPSGGGDVRRSLLLCFPKRVTSTASVHIVYPTIKWQGHVPRGYTFRFFPDGWSLSRGPKALAQGDATGDRWKQQQILLETVTLDRQAQCRLNGQTVYEGTDPGEQVSNEGTVVIESPSDVVQVIAMQEDFVESASRPPKWERGDALLEDALSPDRAGDWVVEGQAPTWERDGLVCRHTSVVWHKRLFASPFVMEFETAPLQAPKKFSAGVTDSIWFWLASDPRHPDDFFAETKARSDNPSLYSYLPLRFYWVDFGGNNNTTTRLRYNPLRQLIRQFTDPPRLLKPGRTYKITIVANGPHQEYWCDGERWAYFYDDDPPSAGHIGFRAFVADHRIKNLRVYRLKGP